MPRQDMTPEAMVSSAVRGLLDAEHIFHIRTNSGTIVLEGRNGKKRAMQLSPRGTADLLALVPHAEWYLPVWIEIKSATGKLRPEQESFRDDVLSRGHAFVVARSSDDVLDWLRRFRKLHGR